MFELYIIIALALFAYMELTGIRSRYAALMAMAWPLGMFYWIGITVLGLIGMLVCAIIAYKQGRNNRRLGD